MRGLYNQRIFKRLSIGLCNNSIPCQELLIAIGLKENNSDNIPLNDKPPSDNNDISLNDNSRFLQFVNDNKEYIIKNIFKINYIPYFVNYVFTESNKKTKIICNKISKAMNIYSKINNFQYICYDKIYNFKSLFIIKSNTEKIIFNSDTLNSSSIIPDGYKLETSKQLGNYILYIYCKFNTNSCPIKPIPKQITYILNKNNTQTTQTTQTTPNFPWDTSTTTLFYNDSVKGLCPIVLVGTSLTTTEYMASQYSSDTFYDFSSDTINNNIDPVIDFINSIPVNLSTNTVSKMPCLRIPMCADYWLYGSAQSSVVNTYFTAQQYQQAIKQIILTTYNNTNNPFLTIILDLHWNYATASPKQSYNGTDGNNYLSGQQLPLCGVFLSNESTSGNLPDNTLDFWRSIAETFGIDSQGNELVSNGFNSQLKKNIFFEIYNEPFCDRLVYNPGQAYIPHNMYNTKYDLYINGGQLYMNSTSDLYSFTGFGVIYNELRIMNCYNLLVISSSDNYAYFNFTSGAQWNYYYEGIDDDVVNTLKNTYNCFTCLRDAIENVNGLVVRNPSGGNYPKNIFQNVILGSHPYSGLYSGATKLGGFHNPTLNDDPYNNIAGYEQIMSSLQNSSMDKFYMSNPCIVTEYGQFDLPWSDYQNGSTNKVASDFAYPDNYKNPLNAVLGEPYYNGTWYDINKVQNIGPAIIPYFHAYINLNISFTVWAWRPNSGGNGNAYGCNQYASGYGWAGTQPDFVSGSFLYQGNLVNGNACENGTLKSQIISSNTQDLNLYENLGCQGPDFGYLTNTYITNIL